nr:hypothetical protein BaRGS_030101 [Batillaria attramentaria]
MPVDDVVEELVNCAQDNHLVIIVDEAQNGPEFELFCDKLHSRLPSVQIWAAAAKHRHIPWCLRRKALSGSFRSIRDPSKSRESLTADIQLYHQGHKAREPKDCEQCGKDVANALKKLHDGDARSSTPLRYTDVFVLMRGDTDPYDEERHRDGRVLHQAIGVVQGLRDAGIPTRCRIRDEDVDDDDHDNDDDKEDDDDA